METGKQKKKTKDSNTLQDGTNEERVETKETSVTIPGNSVSPDIANKEEKKEIETSSTSSSNNEIATATLPSTKKLDDGKHHLECSWTFWFDKKAKDKTKKYEENLIAIGSFSTIEDFWRYYSHLTRPADMPKESNYHLFRTGVTPMWESFPKGGCFIKKVKKTEAALLGKMWEELLFATIGEVFEDPDIVGVVLSMRSKEDVLSIWNKKQSKPHSTI